VRTRDWQNIAPQPGQAVSETGVICNPDLSFWCGLLGIGMRKHGRRIIRGLAKAALVRQPTSATSSSL